MTSEPQTSDAAGDRATGDAASDGVGSAGDGATGDAATAISGAGPATGSDAATAGRLPTRWESIRHRIVTPPAIYGTLLVSAIIGTSEDGDTDLQILGTTIPTLLVFWVAHVFAEAIAHYGRNGHQRVTMREAVRFSIGLSSGLLYAGVIPCGLLVLGVIGALDEGDAYALSLLVPVFLLGALGWFAIADRGGAWHAKLLAGFLTGLLGLVVILLKIVFH